jgi:glycosyltransferase involved in cell wall biosynthesis
MVLLESIKNTSFQSNLVSVIIPCYNQGQYLDEAVDSVLSQSFQNFEIIIVNDGSTDDDTVSKLKNYNKPKCRVINTANNGLAAARNNGIRESSGRYILPLDADDKIDTGYLEAAALILDEKEEIGIVYCEAEYFGEKTGRWNLPVFSPSKMLMANSIFCCSMFRKADYLKTTGFNTNMKYGWEDWDFWLSLIELGKGVHKLPDVHFYYRIKENDSMLTELTQNSEKRNYSLKTLYLNHLEFYLKQIGNPIELYSELTRIKSSKEFKTGRFILLPFRGIKKFYKSFF